MSGNRKAAEQELYYWIEKILPNGGNTQIYRSHFETMSDDEFDVWMTQLAEGAIRLAIITPNMDQAMLDVDRNFQIADELGHEFFQNIIFEGTNGSPSYLSPKKYLVVDLPLRRQAQLQQKKISIPEDNRSVDNLTGQPTGASKGSKLSFPELQIMASMQLDASTIEMIKLRGGDQKAFEAMNDSIAKTGGVSQTNILALNTKVKSTQTLDTFLVCMHLQNSLSAK